jgi:hypothetical protein
MTNENELKVGESVDFLESMYKFLMLPRHAQLDSAINLIKSQQTELENTKKALAFMSECQKNWSSQCIKKQSRIELLESAIREFNDADKAWCAARTDVGFKILDRHEAAKSQLTYLMENEK